MHNHFSCKIFEGFFLHVHSLAFILDSMMVARSCRNKTPPKSRNLLLHFYIRCEFLILENLLCRLHNVILWCFWEFLLASLGLLSELNLLGEPHLDLLTVVLNVLHLKLISGQWFGWYYISFESFWVPYLTIKIPFHRKFSKGFFSDIQSVQMWRNKAHCCDFFFFTIPKLWWGTTINKICRKINWKWPMWLWGYGVGRTVTHAFSASFPILIYYLFASKPNSHH